MEPDRGLGHVGVKIAKAMAAHVTVLSHSPNKAEDARRLGADDFIATHDADVFAKNAKRFDFILDTVSAQHDYNVYLGMLKRDGTMVLVGLSESTPLSAGPLIMGATCGIGPDRHGQPEVVDEISARFLICGTV